MRTKWNPQESLDYSGSHLKVTNEYYGKYEAVSSILDQAPELVERIHQDLEKALQDVNRKGARDGPFRYTSENVLRTMVCQVVEGESLRGIVVRIDDSVFLRRFVRIDHGRMMDYTTLCKLKNSIRNDTWEEINRLLAQRAVQRGWIQGDNLRMDTTAVETNVHYPTDSGLLWDLYRVLAREIEKAREIDPQAVGSGRLQRRHVKRLHQGIGRRAASKGRSARRLKPLYSRLIRSMEHVFGGAWSVREALVKNSGSVDAMEIVITAGIVEQIEHYLELGIRVLDQTRRGSWKASLCPTTKRCSASSSRTPSCSSVGRRARRSSSSI